jgi:hypothetical protein
LCKKGKRCYIKVNKWHAWKNPWDDTEKESVCFWGCFENLRIIVACVGEGTDNNSVCPHIYEENDKTHNLADTVKKHVKKLCLDA